MAAALATLWSFGFRGGHISSGVVLMGPATRLTDPSTLGIFMSAIYPGLGEATRLMLHKRHAFPTLSATMIVIGERLVDTIALGLTLACLGTVSVAAPEDPPNDTEFVLKVAEAMASARAAKKAGHDKYKE